MTFLVIGKNGQFGRTLTSLLSSRGIEYEAFGSKELDIRSSSKTFELVKALGPKVIINAAGWTDVDNAEYCAKEAFAVNAEGPQNLALASKNVGAIFIHISSDYVFSGESTIPWSEDSMRIPATVYGKTKASGEDSVMLNYSEKSYIFRTSWLYGQFGKNFALTMTRAAIEGRQDSSERNRVNVVNDQFGQPTHSLDLANQIVNSVLNKIPFGIYHATNSGQASWYEFAYEIFGQVGADVSRVIPVSTLDFPRPANRPKFSVLGHESWRQTSIEPMRDWRIALHEAMPAIISAVNTKE